MKSKSDLAVLIVPVVLNEKLTQSYNTRMLGFIQDKLDGGNLVVVNDDYKRKQ